MSYNKYLSVCSLHRLIFGATSETKSVLDYFRLFASVPLEAVGAHVADIHIGIVYVSKTASQRRQATTTGISA